MNLAMTTGIAFFVMIFGGMAVIGIYVFMQRNKNVAKAQNHTWVEIIPRSGTSMDFRVPNEMIGGVPAIYIPDATGKVTSLSPIHFLGESGEFPAIYPPGKMKFIQVIMQKIIYYEGDAEPLSNVDNRPIVSGHRIAALVNGSNIAAADVIRQSQDESGLKPKPINKSMLLLTILVCGALIASIVAAVFAAKSGGASGMPTWAKELTDLVKQALGLQ